MLFPSTPHALVLVSLLSSHLVTSNPTPGNKQARTSIYWDSILGYSKTLLETADDLFEKLHSKRDPSLSLKHAPKSTKTHYLSKEKCTDLHVSVSTKANKFLESADKLKNSSRHRGGRYTKVKAATGELLREAGELFKWYCGVLYGGRPLHPHWVASPGPTGILKPDKNVPEGMKHAIFTQKASNRIYQLCFLLSYPTMFSRDGLHDLRQAILVAQVAYYLRIRVAEDPNSKKVVLWKRKSSGEDGFIIDIAEFERSLLDALMVAEGLDPEPKLRITDIDAPEFMEYAFVSVFTVAYDLKFVPTDQDLVITLNMLLSHYMNTRQYLHKQSSLNPENTVSAKSLLPTKSVLDAFGFPEKDAKVYEDFVKSSKRTRSIDDLRRSSTSSDDGSSSQHSRFYDKRVQL